MGKLEIEISDWISKIQNMLFKDVFITKWLRKVEKKREKI